MEGSKARPKHQLLLRERLRVATPMMIFVAVYVVRVRFRFPVSCCSGSDTIFLFRSIAPRDWLPTHLRCQPRFPPEGVQ